MAMKLTGSRSEIKAHKVENGDCWLRLMMYDDENMAEGEGAHER